MTQLTYKIVTDDRFEQARILHPTMGYVQEFNGGAFKQDAIRYVLRQRGKFTLTTLAKECPGYKG